jgi:hypothetical protein
MPVSELFLLFSPSILFYLFSFFPASLSFPLTVRRCVSFLDPDHSRCPRGLCVSLTIRISSTIASSSRGAESPSSLCH